MLQKSLLSSSWLVDFCLYDLLQGLGVFKELEVFGSPDLQRLSVNTNLGFP